MSLFRPDTLNAANNSINTMRDNFNQVSLAIDILQNSVSAFEVIRDRVNGLARLDDIVKASGSARAISIGAKLDSFSKLYPQIRLGKTVSFADITPDQSIVSTFIVGVNAYIDDTDTLKLLNDGKSAYMRIASNAFSVYTSGLGYKGDLFPSGGETLLSINIDDGYTTTFLGGSQITNDRFKVNLNGATRFIVDKTVMSYQNTIPKTWQSATPAFQIGVGGALWAESASSNTYLTDHLYYDSSYKFLGSDNKYGTSLTLSNGEYLFRNTTASGTDGNSATVQELMRLTQTGVLSIGNISPKVWSTSFKAIQLYEDSSIISSVLTTILSNHLYIDSDSAWKFLGTTNGYGAVYLQSGGDHIFRSTDNQGTNGTSATLTEKMRLTQAGELLVGTSTPFGSPTVVPQTIYGSGTASYTSYQTAATGTGSGNGSLIGHDNTTGLTLYNYENTGMRFATNNTSRMTISSTGIVKIDTNYLNVDVTLAGLSASYVLNRSSSGHGLAIQTLANSSAAWSFQSISGAGSSYMFSHRSDGYLYAPVIYNRPYAGSANVLVTSSGYMYRATSSERYKKNIRKTEVDTSKIYRLQMKTYERRESDITDHGFIAEHTWMREPAFCEYDSNGRPDGIHWNAITCSLVEEIKKLRKRIEKLENK